MTFSHQSQDNIDTAAADWAARLNDEPLGAAERRALIRWLAQSPAHRDALAEAQAAWAQMCRLGAEAIPVELPPPAPARLGGARGWMRWAALAASVLVTALAGVGYWCGNPLTALAADHRTAPAQVRTISLPDGTLVRLGPDTAIAVHYDTDIRRVELLAGQADFTAAPLTASERRSFVVAAGNGTARALGTRFMVNRLPDAVEVAVAEHSVEVALPDASGRVARTLLTPGQSVRYRSTELGTVAAVPYAQLAAWQDGTLVFDRVPLAEVTTILNRYRRDRIVIGDAALAARTVSGVFQTGTPDATLDTITQTLGIRSATLPPVVTLLY